MVKVFIDGNQGTTGLRIFDRLSHRDDIELLTLPEEYRKDVSARKEMINSCSVAFLCLPDEAAREAVELSENDDTVIIDTSTAHRTAPGWVYGFPELSADFEQKIKSAKRIANPGCHASGFIALVYPLINSGLLDPKSALTCFSLTGYSGGGKKMIAQYEGEKTDDLLSPRNYGLSQNHKHLREMTTICSLETEPIFSPIVADYYAGMQVCVPVFADMLSGSLGAEGLNDFYRSYYPESGLVKSVAAVDAFSPSNALAGKDIMEISVTGNDKRLLLTARFDNLGKGASGAAIENMNLVLAKRLDYSLSV